MHDLGIDAVHWSTVGAGNAPDTELLQYAAENDQIIVTHDLDFGTMLAVSGLAKPSVIQLRDDDVSPEHVSPRLVGALNTLATELQTGALVTLDAQKLRSRLLPIR